MNRRPKEKFDFEEAKEKACEEVGYIDFNRLEFIEWKAVNAEDENGVFKDY